MGLATARAFAQNGAAVALVDLDGALAAGWKKGQIGKNMQDARHHLCQPRPHVESLDAINLCKHSLSISVTTEQICDDWKHMTIIGRTEPCETAPSPPDQDLPISISSRAYALAPTA